MDTRLSMDTRLHASATIQPLRLPPREAFARVREMGYPFVQLSAKQDGLRPRELGGSARRDLLATLRRLDLSCSGIDLWIPPDHFSDPAHVDRAVAAVRDALILAHDFGGVPLSMILPPDQSHEAIVSELASVATHHGVPLADFSNEPRASEAIGIGIDPPALLSRGDDPAEKVLHARDRLIAARLSDLSTEGMRAPIGEPNSRLDVHGYIAALAAVQFRAPLVVDARQWNDPAGGLAKSSQELRTAFGSLIAPPERA